ncbi:aspartyl/glutamyl-tRNA(Asn/Gln) amidotransferase, B subunit [Cyphellophora europaea CBS 101466]|uniref:Glutamyl-tRNA(Gln) amidotransferase subunit B, mitochondrial n=1 Tax=Cyphellophora europaea (strain CBS 101466) TaxID=1220924 RepID=W2S326_CYPE1|nr:aspartyl/glutamyl-tRNA(Asn/Gln) amidotransferase, B subunit [Cyphellophora europaea CBS 101466]ETN43116.1 aspartyl/glutamyl-tRNA(Asn/Gln) amidotransferase, B subunit [Cyphellophora europaea CBS 101466]
MLPRWRLIACRRAASPRTTSISRFSPCAKPPQSPALAGPRHLHTTKCLAQEVAPLRKELKETIKAARSAKRGSGDGASHGDIDHVEGWELTVGIEIHAQLNTARKLFSDAFTDPTLEPNSRVAQFDLALPGSQPVFQYATLIPAIRGAVVLGCEIQSESRFDRKHYFYHDQPSGYQITQYYQPLAKDGYVIINDANDELENGQELVVGIKQVQLEQDTARTHDQDAQTSLVDFNRAGHPLIEIISLPQIHSPRVAAAYVKKVQALLFSVDAVTTGMELGGLRADVNVSVRRTDRPLEGGLSYGGVSGLGQRAEIKNLSSFKGVEDAIRAERDRQIAVLESGGVVEGETRGWSVSRPGVTRRLRGKEGEIDYRYMPDPDIPPLYIAPDLVQHLTSTLPPIPEELALMLQNDYGLSVVDSWALLTLDDGRRLIYFQEVVDELVGQLGTSAKLRQRALGRAASNWVLHELGAMLTQHERTWTEDIVPARQLGRILYHLERQQITTPSAKLVLKLVFEGDRRPVDEIIKGEGLLYVAMSDEEYKSLADQIIADFPGHVKDIQEKGKHGKIKFLLGQMMRRGEKGRVQATTAEEHLKRQLSGVE